MEFDNRPQASMLGQTIRGYREQRGFTREKLAELLAVEASTLRSWERGQVISIRLSHKKKLREVLGIPANLLGIETSLSLDEAREMQKQAFLFLEHGDYLNAEQTSNALIQGATISDGHFSEEMKPLVARAYYAHGLATATLTDEPREALSWYRLMQNLADELKNRNGLAIAMTYQAEMYRRLGRMYRQGKRKNSGNYYGRAQSLLEAVLEQSRRIELDNRVVGNCQQLLARVYLAQRLEDQVFDALQRAEELAYAEADHSEEDWYLCFCPCGVKEELAKSQMLMKDYERGFETLETIQQLLADASPRWAIPTTITHAEFLIRYARFHADLSSLKRGKDLMVHGFMQAKKHNHFRQQARIHRLIDLWAKGDEIRMKHTFRLQEDVRKIDEGGEE